MYKNARHRNTIFDLISSKPLFSSCLSAQMTIAEFEANGINQYIRVEGKFQLGDDCKGSLKLRVLQKAGKSY